MASAARVPTGRNAEEFRQALSDQPSAEWSAALAETAATSRKNVEAAAALKKNRPRRGVWSEETVWGWLTWTATDAAPGFALGAVGVVEHPWANTKRRRRAALANADQSGRQVYRRRLPTLSWAGLIRAGIAAFVVIIVGVILQIKGAWPLSVALLAAIAGYYFPSILSLGSRRHVRVFAGPALLSTSGALYELLAPVTAISRVAGGSAMSRNKEPLVHTAVETALAATWQATDPGISRTELGGVIQRLNIMAVSISDLTQSAVDVTAASQFSQFTSDNTAVTATQTGSTGLLSQLDQTNQSLADSAKAQKDAANALRDINQPTWRTNRHDGTTPSNPDQ